MACLRKALAYTDCSRNTYYYKKKMEKKRPRNARQQQQQVQMVLEKRTEEIILQRPSYGTRRMAAMLTRIIGKSINRKRVQKIYHKLNLTVHLGKKEKLYAQSTTRTSKRLTDQTRYGKSI